MSNPLRDRQSVKTLVANRQIIEIAEKIGSFERLASSVERDFGALGEEVLPPDWRELPVRGRLGFGPAAAGSTAPVMSGSLQARVPALCQRCLEPFGLQVDTPVDLRFVAEGGPDAGGDGETWELTDDTVQPIDIVDELLVMAMPLSPRHQDTAACAFSKEVRPAQENTTRPFANLGAQMGKVRKD